MNGLAIELPAGITFTDLTLRKFSKIDPIERDGSLLLLEPGNLVTPWPAGVPANGADLINLFKAKADAIIGAATVQPTFIQGGGIGNLTKGKVERTAKGGLHVIVSVVNAPASGDGVAFGMPPKIYQWMYDHPTHDFYFSIWAVITRIGDGTAWATTAEIGSSSTASTGGHMATTTLGSGASGTTLSQDQFGNVLGPTFAYVASRGNALASNFTGKLFGPIHGAPASSINTGRVATINASAGKWPSIISYRSYLEDLTLSGRGYLDAAADDYDQFNFAFTNPSGRYYGDTYTAVTAVP